MARPSMGSNTRLRRELGLVAIVLTALGLACWRVAFVLSAFDLDTDAYEHHSIARWVLQAPSDPTVHWVWLPMFHWAQAAAVALGATLRSVRLFNVAVAAATPIVLYLGMRARRTMRPDAAPLLAALLAALSPLCMQMGTTGQTEPAFALLMLAVVWAVERERAWTAGALLGVGALFRYEAWAVAPTLGAVWAWDALRSRRAATPVGLRRMGARFVAVVALPALAIFAWAAVRHHDGERWFAFVRETQAFAHEAMRVTSVARTPTQLWKDLTYYPIDIATAVMGPFVALALVGFVRTARVDGPVFVGVGLACLAFITYTWLGRGSLGLYRHFVSVVPLYAALMANGVLTLAEGIAAGARRLLFRRSVHAFAATPALRAAVVAGFGFALLTTTAKDTKAWMESWRERARAEWVDRRAVAAALRTLPADATIFCDEATLEILSELDRRRFERIRLRGDAKSARALSAAVRRDGRVYAASWSHNLRKVLGAGRVVYLPEPLPSSGQDEPYYGLVVLEFTRDGLTADLEQTPQATATLRAMRASRESGARVVVRP